MSELEAVEERAASGYTKGSINPAHDAMCDVAYLLQLLSAAEAALAESRERLEGVERERDEATDAANAVVPGSFLAAYGNARRRAVAAEVNLVAAEQVIEAAERVTDEQLNSYAHGYGGNPMRPIRDALSAYRATTTPASRGDE